MKLILISIAFLALAFAGLAIKILVKKDGKFPGTCAGNSSFLRGEGVACGACGALPEDGCKRKLEKG